MAPVIHPQSTYPRRKHKTQGQGIRETQGLPQGLSDLAKGVSAKGSGIAFRRCLLSPVEPPGQGLGDSGPGGGTVPLSRAETLPGGNSLLVEEGGRSLRASASDCCIVPGGVMRDMSCHMGLNSAPLTFMALHDSDSESEAYEEGENGSEGRPTVGGGKEASRGAQPDLSERHEGSDWPSDGLRLQGTPACDVLAAELASSPTAEEGAPEKVTERVQGKELAQGADSSLASWLSWRWGLDGGAEDVKYWFQEKWEAASQTSVVSRRETGSTSASRGTSGGGSSGDWRTAIYESAADVVNLWKAASAEAEERRLRLVEETSLVEWIKKSEIIWDADPMAVVPIGCKTDISKLREVAPACVLPVTCLGQEGAPEEEVFDEVPLEDEERQPASSPWLNGSKADSFGRQFWYAKEAVLDHVRGA